MIRKLKYIIPALIVLATSCKKSLDINVDPYQPLILSVSKLLPSVEVDLATSLAPSSGISQVLEVYTHRLVVRENPNAYEATGGNFNIIQNWNIMFARTFTNLDAIIAEGTQKGNLRYSGIAYILKAYGYSQMVDVYGDVPFTDVNKLITEGQFGSKFDKGVDIYPKLITMLDKGIADINNTAASNLIKPGSDDIIYKGDIALWIKAANTIKLKLLLQQRLVKNVSTDINALIASGNLISATKESFLLPFGPNGATDDRNPGFGDYVASQRSQYQSPWFYEILKGYNAKIYTGITDPRLPYYFFNQLKTGLNPSNPTEYRDGSFLSIYFGSTGPNAAQSQQNYMTLFGIYPVGGRYDDAAGGTASATSGTGAAPYRFITYADVLFMKAELMKAGVISGDAKATLQLAIKEAFNQVDYVVTTYVKPTQTVPAVSTSAATTAYIAAIMAQYDAKPAQQLESIMTQKWISSYGSAVDAYTDYRRTGFPVLFDPSNTTQAPGGFVQPPINGDPSKPAQAKVRVQVSKKYPLTLPWSSTELSTNRNAPSQKEPSSYKPFWLP